MTAELLDIQVITYANRLSLDGGTLTAERKLETCTEAVSCALPAAVCVSPDMNKPRIPGMRLIMSAGKKPIQELGLAELGFSGAEIQAVETRVSGAVMERKHIFFDAKDPEAVGELADAIIREGVKS